MPTEVFFNLKKEKQDRILNACLEEFCSYRLEEAQVKRIIEKAQIARGSFYQYFNDIEDVFTFVFFNLKGKEVEGEILSNDVSCDVEIIELIRRIAKKKLNAHRNNINDYDIRLINQVRKSDRALTLMIEAFELIPKRYFQKSNGFSIVQEMVFPSMSFTFKKYLKSNINAEEALAEIDKKINIIRYGLEQVN